MDHSLKIFVDHVSKTKKDVSDVPQSGWYLQNTRFLVLTLTIILDILISRLYNYLQKGIGKYL